MLSEKKKKNLPIGITILVLQFCFYSCNFQVPKGLEDLGLLLNFQKFTSATAVSEGNITVTGTVNDASGTAISGGILDISRSTSANTLSRATADTKVYSDTNGKFTMNIYAGSFTIKVSRSDGTLVGSFALKVTNATTAPEVSSATGLQVTGIAAAPVGSTTGTTGGTTTPVAFLSIPNGNPSSILEGNSSTIGVIMTGSVTQSYTVTITSSNPSAISVSPSSIEVTPTNFSINKQITLTALQDENLVSENVKITLSSEGLNKLEFTLITTDDDTQNIVLAGVSSLTQTNSGSISVKLTKEPPSNTTVNLVSSLPSTLTLSTSSLTFTPSNYSLPQTVTVNALQDANQDSETVTITASAVGITDPSTWNVLCIDDPTIVFTGGSSVAEGGTMILSITLAGNPGVDRTVNFVSGKTSSLTVSPSSMFFTPSSFNSSQTLTVTGVEDTNVISEAVIITASGEGLVSSTKTVNTVDNDTMNIVLGGATVVVEGSTGTVTVALSNDPSGNFIVNMNSAAPSTLSVSPEVLTFNSLNYSTPQNVTLSAPVDGNQTSESVVITASASGVTSQTRSVQVFDVNPPTFVSVTPGLLKTGQTVSYAQGDDGQYQKGISKSFSTGSASGLLFQRCNRGQTPPSCTGTPTVSTYSDAKSYCETLSLGGKVWRLPTINELSYLWDYSKSSFDNTAFPNAVFNSTPPLSYLRLWSSTDYTNPNTPGDKWGFRISSDVGDSSYGGSSYGTTQTNNNATARCVTGTDASTNTNTFTDNFDGTVTDSSTGLIWQQTPSFWGFWSGAINYCNTLSLGGKTWRLPNINEMRTIVNYSNLNPAINAVFSFPSYHQLWWTSTTAAHDSTRAWYYFFVDGQQGYSAKETGNMYARCVTGP